MFTGIIEEMGSLHSMRKLGGGYRLSIRAPRSSRDLKVSDSVAVNGVCLTVVEKSGDLFHVDAVEETIRKTSLGSLLEGSRVNLELPMRLNERLGGHLVLGHVDATGSVGAIEQRETSWMFTIFPPPGSEKYLIPVGSIAVDGVSLTIAELDKVSFRVSIIPHTISLTIFQYYKVGDPVNLEFDIIGKYIEQQLLDSGYAAKMKFPLERELRDIGY
jgi:riboflavin synthase